MPSFNDIEAMSSLRLKFQDVERVPIVIGSSVNNTELVAQI